MLLLMSILKFVSFPDRKDSIFKRISSIEEDMSISSSGSLGLFYSGDCHLTNPNETVIDNGQMEWCSNIAKSEDDKPWISYNVKDRAMKLTGYSIRNGCCYRSCCCQGDTHFVDSNTGCCCRLYRFSLQGSNDNQTWTTIHQAEKDENIYLCTFKTYKFKKTESFRFVRFVMDKEYPGCPFCMQINQIDFYGELSNSPFAEDEENDESVSIIGKINRNHDN